MFDVTKDKWDYVERVTPLDNGRLHLVFRDGKTGVYDMAPQFRFACYAPLKSPAVFKSARVAGGTVCWPGDIDIAPEELYFNSVPED